MCFRILFFVSARITYVTRVTILFLSLLVFKQKKCLYQSIPEYHISAKAELKTKLLEFNFSHSLA